MAKVTGVGGVFFRSKEPNRLRDWYAEHLGVPVDEGGYVTFKWKEGQTEKHPGSTVWAPFPEDTEYFKSNAAIMINFRVDDLDELLAQLRAAKIDVDEKIEEMDGIGRFGWITDPEGNRVELWEPAEGA